MTDPIRDLMAVASQASRPHSAPTDIGNAERFVNQFGADVRYAAAYGDDGWLVWTGTRFEHDRDRLRVIELAKAIGGELEETADSKAAAAWARYTSSLRGIRAMLELAKPIPGVNRVAAELDRDPYLLNTPGGTIDLRTGALRAHARSDELTLSTTATPSSPSPLWLAFLERVLPDAEVRAFVQRLFGHALIGAVLEHVLPILHGSGANGKSVFMRAVTNALGDYAGTAPVTLLMGGQYKAGQASPEVVDLRGRRLVTCSESKEDARLSAERVKAITGGDTITGRPLYGHPISFEPSHLVCLATNHRPRVSDDSPAIWRRLALIPFTVTIPEDDRDPELAAKLAAQADAVLAWLVDGCLAYQRDGLTTPEAVKAATTAYREGEDTFGQFLADTYTNNPTGTVPAGDLQKTYAAWGAEHGAERLTSAAVADKLEQRGYRRRPGKLKNRVVWAGLEPNEDGKVVGPVGPPEEDSSHTHARAHVRRRPQNEPPDPTTLPGTNDQEAER